MSGSSPNMTVDNIFLSYSPNPIPTNFQLRSAFSSSTLPFHPIPAPSLHPPPPPDKPSLKLLDKISRSTQFYPNQSSTTGVQPVPPARAGAFPPFPLACLSLFSAPIPSLSFPAHLALPFPPILALLHHPPTPISNLLLSNY